jgi:hypothetical protein
LLNITGEKPFLCDICSYSTNRKYNLKLHQRKHEAESSELANTATTMKNKQAAYTCKNCGEAFKFKTELKAHLKIHDSRTLNHYNRLMKEFTEIEHELQDVQDKDDLAEVKGNQEVIPTIVHENYNVSVSDSAVKPIEPPLSQATCVISSHIQQYITDSKASNMQGFVQEFQFDPGMEYQSSVHVSIGGTSRNCDDNWTFVDKDDSDVTNIEEACRIIGGA